MSDELANTMLYIHASTHTYLENGFMSFSNRISLFLPNEVIIRYNKRKRRNCFSQPQPQKIMQCFPQDFFPYKLHYNNK